MRAANRIRAAVLGALACLTLAAPAGSNAAPVGQVESFDPGCSPRDLLAGPDSTLWFSCFRERSGGGRGAVGLISPTGKVVAYGKGIDRGSEPGDLALGPDGNLWFAINTGINLLPRQERPAAIGRLEPSGRVTTFRAGLDPKATLGDLVAGPDGNVWFAEGGPAPAIGRIAPDGTIAEFRAGLSSKRAPGGLAVGREGNLWFSDPGATIGRIAPDGTITEFGPAPTRPGGLLGGAPAVAANGDLWLSGGAKAPAIVRVDPLGSVTEFSAGLDPAGVELSPLAAGPDGTFWFTSRGQIRGAIAKLAIGRVSPTGEIAEFSDCLHSGPPFTGPERIVAGPEGNLWFASVTTRSLPNIGTPPAIGRVTPSGQITEFRQGVLGEPRLLAASPDGHIWFATRGGSEISRIATTSAPAETFLVERARRVSGGVAQLPVTVPGAGQLQLEQRALLLPKGRQRSLPHLVATAAASSCGTPLLPVQVPAAARQRLRRTGAARIAVDITFTADGGAANTQPAVVLLRR